MQSRTKIRLDALENVRRAFESLPECPVEEVTKTQAVQMLVPQIHAMRAKGYSLRAVASFLSEQGIVVTELSLRSYLGHANGGAGEKKSRGKKKSGRDRKPATVQAAGPREACREVPGEPGQGQLARGEEGLGQEEKKAEALAAPLAAPRVVPVATAVAKDVALPAQPPAALERRSAFVPRKDSEEI